MTQPRNSVLELSRLHDSFRIMGSRKHLNLGIFNILESSFFFFITLSNSAQRKLRLGEWGLELISCT